MEKGYDVFGIDLIYYEEWKNLKKERFVQGDILHLPFGDEQFDTVLLFEVFEHLEHPSQILDEIRRITKKNIIVSVPDCELHSFLRESGLTFFHWVDRTHVSFFTEESLKNLLSQKGFDPIFLKRINPVYPEIILFHNFCFSVKLSKFLSKIISKIKIRNSYMTLLCVGEKRLK